MEVEVVRTSVVAYGVSDVEVKAIFALVRACRGDVGSDGVCTTTCIYWVGTLRLLLIAAGEERGEERDGPYCKEIFDCLSHAIVIFEVNKILLLQCIDQLAEEGATWLLQCIVVEYLLIEDVLRVKTDGECPLE